ncbi:MAG: hypothetical protein VW405_17610 [Rhodospirillaceae bacterium]
MEQRLSLMTLGIADLAASTAFYERLGWRASPPSNEAVTFFQLGGIIFGLYGRDALADEIERGDMVVPFQVTLPRGLGCYFVCPEERSTSPLMSAFRDWLIAGCAADAGHLNEAAHRQRLNEQAVNQELAS